VTLAAITAAASWGVSPVVRVTETTLDVQESHMPLMRFDLYEGRSDEELKKLLDTAHSVTVEVLKIPARDRYQIVNEHQSSLMIVEDTGLAIPRTNYFVMIQITSRPRTREMKEKFYKRMTEELEKQCSIAPSDVMMNFVICTDEEWSFGLGRAQFLTKEL
jgi:phenylpyruvate tautomerase PptA (4-oxalocrotonate tautomerase family)